MLRHSANCQVIKNKPSERHFCLLFLKASSNSVSNNVNVMRQSACLVINPITIDSLSPLHINRTTVWSCVFVVGDRT